MEENKEFTSAEPVVESTPIVQELEVKEEIQEASEVVAEPTTTEEIVSEPKKKKKGPIIFIIILLLLIIGAVIAILVLKPFDKKKNDKEVIDTPKEVKSDYRMSGNSLEAFDLYFLKLENKNTNLIYSPLSIKYALEMIAEGTKGESRAQLDAIIGDYKAKKYINNENMSFANAFFIRNNFKEYVKETYINNLTNKYGAEVIYDSFESPNTINDWISNKTFKLINNLLDDVSKNDFILVNALGIDMKWNNQIHCTVQDNRTVPCYGDGTYYVNYLHEKLQGEDHEYEKVSYPYGYESEFPALTFDGKENKKSSEIFASFNKYDAVKEIGEERIRSEVTKAYQEWLKSDEANDMRRSGDPLDTDINEIVGKYIEELNSNYGKEEVSTDFTFYSDDNVKVFAKDLQSSNGTTLQYVGIMPKTSTLKEFVENSTADSIQKLINSTKNPKKESFADGYVTIIEGKIPLFQYEYELDLLNDLKKLGVTDVFDLGKANFGNMLTEDHGEALDKAKHKATIEFSNDGIKAAAVSLGGGAGNAGGGFNYLFEVPTIRVDLTFDKPYLYLIRDKDTGEVWFVGTVYDPINK